MVLLPGNNVRRRRRRQSQTPPVGLYAKHPANIREALAYLMKSRRGTMIDVFIRDRAIKQPPYISEILLPPASCGPGIDGSMVERDFEIKSRFKQ